MQNKIILAIDPGQNGGLALSRPAPLGSRMRGKHRKTTAQNLPEDSDLRDLFEKIQREYSENGYAESFEPVCYLEQVGGYVGKKQPGSHMFNFGDGFGFIRGLLSAYRIKLVLVRPQTWQRGIPGLKGEQPQRKRALKEHAARLFPALSPTLATADALCILHYAEAMESGGAALESVKPPRPIVAKPEPVEQKKTIVLRGTKRNIAAGLGVPGSTENEAGAVVPVVDHRAAIEALHMAEQRKRAVAWCEAKGWPVPAARTADFSGMFDYWFNLAINGEA